MRYYDAHNLTSWRSCHNKWTSCDQVIIYSSWTLWVFLAKSLRPLKLYYSVRSQQPMYIDNDGCFCYQLNGISDSVSNLHKSSLQKKIASLVFYVAAGCAAVSWFVASELCRVRVQALRPDVQFVKCSIKDTFLLLSVDRVAPLQAQRADSLGRAMQIEFNAAANRIWGWLTMLVASQVFVADSNIDLLSLADDCFIIRNA